MGSENIQQEVAGIRWFHSIDLGGGVVTPGNADTSKLLKRIALPERLEGKRVLDVGARDGFFSFEAKRRGAAEVVAVDLDWETNRRGFDLARSVLKSDIKDRVMSVYDLDPKDLGSYDLVLCLGLLYHLEHPLLALQKIHAVARDQVIVESHVHLVCGDAPAMVFYPGTECNHDPTNWWGPNPAAIEAMLKVAGFKRVQKIGVFEDGFFRRLAIATRRALFNKEKFNYRLRYARVVFHAWKT